MPVVCSPAPVTQTMSLNELEFVLGTTEGLNIIGLTGSGYELASENDQEKLKQMLFFGLSGLHYLKCISDHNAQVE